MNNAKIDLEKIYIVCFLEQEYLSAIKFFQSKGYEGKYLLDCKATDENIFPYHTVGILGNSKWGKYIDAYSYSEYTFQLRRENNFTGFDKELFYLKNGLKLFKNKKIYVPKWKSVWRQD